MIHRNQPVLLGLTLLALVARSPAQTPVAFPLTTPVTQQSATLNVSVTVTSGGTANIIQSVTSGTPNMDFVTVPGGTCATGTAYTVGQQCTVAVAFTPKFPGLRRGAVLLQRTDGTLLGSTLLTGNATGSLAVLQPGDINTVAGDGAWIYHGDGVAATAAPIFLPTAIVADAAGDLFLADSANNRIRRVDFQTGLISTVAGSGSPGYSGDNGPATAAMISNPAGIALDGAGNLVFADTGNHAIRRIDAYSGLISTVAGTATMQGYSGDHASATSARLSLPEGVAFDAASNLYIADTGNNVIRRVDAITGLITTYAGTGAATYSGDGGPATAAALSSPWSITFGNDGTLYIADLSNNCVRRVSLTGTITTVAGTGARAFSGDGGPAAAATLNAPAALTFDPAGNLYIADSGNDRVRKVSITDGTIQTIIGTGSEQFTGDGGPANVATLYGPYALFFDQAGNLLLTDMFHNRVRRVGATAVSLQYATIRVSRTSPPQPVGLENDGNATLTLNPDTLNNAALDSGTTTCNSGGTLPTGTDCTLGVEFAPTTIGNPVQGTLTVNTDAGNSPALVNLSGQVLSVNPTSTALTSSSNPALVGDTVTFTATVTSADTGRTGTIIFSDGGTQLCSVTLNASGTAACSTSALALGQHSITASYSGDSNNASSNSPTVAESIKEPTTLTLSASPNPAIVTASVTLSVTASASGPTPTGTVVFLDNGYPIGSATLSAGTASFSTSSLQPWTHPLSVQYAGDTSNAAGTSNTVAEVIQHAPTQTTLATSNSSVPVGTNITFTATVSTTSGPAPTGTVQFSDGATPLGSGTVAANGSATLTLSTLSPGNHTIVAQYSGDGNDLASTSTGLPEAIQQIATTTSLVSDSNPSSAGGTIHLTATVTIAAGATADGPITGMVSFTEGGNSLGTGALNGSGQATIAANTLSVGSHTIVATYSGNTNYAGSTAPSLTEVVHTTATTAILSSSNTSALAGLSVTFTATITSSTGTPTGTVALQDSGTTIAQLNLSALGTAVFSLSNLSVGTHSLTATYAGDANYISSTSAPLSQTVSLATTSLTLSTSSTTIVAGAPLTVTAALTSNGLAPTGTLTLQDSGSPIATAPAVGSSVFTNLNLAVGTHTLTVSYAGDAANAPSISATVTINVTLAATTLSASASATSLVVQSPLTINTSLTSTGITPTGTVTLHDGATILATQGAAVANSFTNLMLPVGAHSLAVTYSGDANNTPAASATLTVTITLASTQTTLTSSSPTPLVDQPITLSAAVVTGSASLSGTITFQNGATILGSVPLSNGISMATLTTTLPFGAQRVTASYSGDPLHAASTAIALTEQVFQPVAATLSASANPTLAGALITFTAHISSPTSLVPTGTVTFHEGASTLATAPLDAAGAATFTSSALTVGSHTVTASYSGDPSFVAAAASLTEIIQSATTQVTLSASANPATFSTALTFSATVSSVGSAATGSVSFTDNGIPIGVITPSSNGTASLTLSTLAPGQHSILATYAGDQNTSPTVSLPLSLSVLQQTHAALTADANPAQTLTPVVLTAVVSPLGSTIPTGVVTFFDGTAALGHATLDATGHATLTIPALSAGTHNLAVSYTGDGNDFAAPTATLNEGTQLRPTASTLTATQTNPGNPQQVTLFYAIRWTGTIAPTGTATFSAGTTVLGSSQLGPSGTVTLNTYPASTTAANTFIVTYSGDTAYAGSTAQATETPTSNAVPFTIQLNPDTVTLASKQHLTTTLTIASKNSFADTLKFGCVGLPYAATCTFSTLQSSLTANGTTSLQLVVDTGDPLTAGPQTTASTRSSGKSTVLLCFMPGFFLAGMALRRVRRASPLASLLTLLLLACAIGGFTGCSGLQQAGTPGGTYTFKLAVSAQQSGVTIDQVVPLTVTQ